MIAQALAFALQVAAAGRLGVAAPQPPDPAMDGLDGAAVVVSVASLSIVAAMDERVGGYVLAHRSATVERTLDAVEPLGRARYLIPGMAVVYVTAVAGRNTDLQRATLRTGIGYAVTDIVGGALKFSVGRHRPDSLNDAWRFEPFRRGSEWHSFPSGHTYHAFALASGIADETDADWPDVLAYGVATLVAAQRVYSRAHWASDAVAGAVLGIGVSRYGRRHLGPRRRTDEAPPDPPILVRLVIPLPR